MTDTPTQTSAVPKFVARVAAVAALAGVVLIPATAQAWWHGGVFIGLPPVVVGPPVVAYPPPYYAPPYPPPYYAPGYYPPPAYGQPPPGAEQAPAPQMSQADTPFGSTCYAGVYVCAAPAQTHVGAGCSCPGLGAPSYGVVQ